MEKFAIGDVVIVLFPFSDLKGQKLRPALILAKAEFNNLILCQITSKSYSSKSAIKLSKANFAHGMLPVESYIRPDKLFTAEPAIIQKSVGRLTMQKKNDILRIVQSLFKPSKAN